MVKYEDGPKYPNFIIAEERPVLPLHQLICKDSLVFQNVTSTHSEAEEELENFTADDLHL
jgi:hypothetical protein